MFHYMLWQYACLSSGAVCMCLEDVYIDLFQLYLTSLLLVLSLQGWLVGHMAISCCISKPQTPSINRKSLAPITGCAHMLCNLYLNIKWFVSQKYIKSWLFTPIIDILFHIIVHQISVVKLYIVLLLLMKFWLLVWRECMIFNFYHRELYK